MIQERLDNEVKFGADWDGKPVGSNPVEPAQTG